MPWGAQTWLRLTKELTYGTRQSSPPGTDVLYPRLYQSDSFSMRPVPQRKVIRSADSGNRRRQVVAGRTVVAGNLATLLYPTQAAYLLGAALTLTSNDLTSYTLDYFDGTRVQSYLGCKVATLGLASSAEGDYVPVSMSWVGQKLDATFTTFTQPADSVFPTEVPYEHVESSTHFVVGGSALTKYSAINVNVKNNLAGTWDELAYITSLLYCGRDVDFDFRAQYIASTFRTAFEAQSALTCSIGWTRTSPAHAVTLDVKSTNYIGTIEDDLPLEGATYQKISVETFFDGTATTDLALTVS